MATKIYRNLTYLTKSISQNITTIRMVAMTHQSRVIKISKYPKKSNYLEQIEHEIPRNNLDKPIGIKTDNSAQAKVNFEDYYKILGVRDNSTIDEIKRSYYILAKRFHPDRVGFNNSSNFQKIVEAYNVLSDSTKKDRYDQLRLRAPNDGIKILSSSSFRFKDQTKKLRQLLDKDCTPTAAMNLSTEISPKYRNGIININITFLESVQGAVKDTYVKTFINCQKCNQNLDRRSLRICTKCNGLGSYTLQTRTYKCHKECDLCYGRCYIALCKCAHCQNRGFLLKESKIRVHINPGVQNNDVIKIPHPDDPKQQLQVKVVVLENDHFKRQKNDIYTEKKISISEAVLGGNLKVRGIYGDIDVLITPGTDCNSQIKLTGKGVKTINSGTGDHYVNLKIEIPKQLTKEQRNIFLELAETEKSTKIHSKN